LQNNTTHNVTRVSNVELPCKYIIFCTLFSYVFKLTLSEYQMKQLHFIHMPKCMKLNHKIFMSNTCMYKSSP